MAVSPWDNAKLRFYFMHAGLRDQTVSLVSWALRNKAMQRNAPSGTDPATNTAHWVVLDGRLFCSNDARSSTPCTFFATVW
jgi:hypothetical protein